MQDVGIDLNAKDNSGWTALHMACCHGQTETVQTMLNNWKEFGIDINAQINQSQTALDLINHYNYESQESNQIRKILIKEYSQIEVTESVQSPDLGPKWVLVNEPKSLNLDLIKLVFLIRNPTQHSCQ